MLISLVLALLYYLLSVGYFVLSTSWATPLILSPHHAKVIEFQNRLLNKSLRATELRSHIVSLEQELKTNTELKDAAIKTLHLHVQFFTTEIENKNQELSEISEAVTSLSKSSSEFKVIIDQNLKTLKKSVRAESRAGMITKSDRALKETFIASLRVKSLEAGYRVDELKQKMRRLTLESGTLIKLQKEVLKIITDIETGIEMSASQYQLQPSHVTFETISSGQRLQQAIANIIKSKSLSNSLKEQLALANKTNDELSQIIAKIEQSPYVKAMNEKMYVIFLPYENLLKLTGNDEVKSCIAFLYCRTVGTVKNIIDGEVMSTHPMFRYPVRGKFIELELIDSQAAEKWMLQFSPAQPVSHYQTGVKFIKKIKDKFNDLKKQ